MAFSKSADFNGNLTFVETTAVLVFASEEEANAVLAVIFKDEEYSAKAAVDDDESTPTRKVISSKTEDCFVKLKKRLESLIPNKKIIPTIKITTTLSMQYQTTFDKESLANNSKEVGSKIGISTTFLDSSKTAYFTTADASVKDCREKVVKLMSYEYKYYGTRDKFSRPEISSHSKLAKEVSNYMSYLNKVRTARPKKESQFEDLYPVDFLKKTEAFMREYELRFFDVSESLGGLLLNYVSKLKHAVYMRNAFFVKFREAEHKAEVVLDKINKSDSSSEQDISDSLSVDVPALAHNMGVSAWLGGIVDSQDNRISNILKEYLLRFDRELSTKDVIDYLDSNNLERLPNPVSYVFNSIKDEKQDEKDRCQQKIDDLLKNSSDVDESDVVDSDYTVKTLADTTKKAVGIKFDKEINSIASTLDTLDKMVKEFRRNGRKNISNVVESFKNDKVKVIPSDYETGSFLANQAKEDQSSDLYNTISKSTTRYKKSEHESKKNQRGYLDIIHDAYERPGGLDPKPNDDDFVADPVNQFVDSLDDIAGKFIRPDANFVSGPIKELYKEIAVLPDADKYGRADIDKENLDKVVNVVEKTGLAKKLFSGDPKGDEKFYEKIKKILEDNYKTSHITETNKSIQDFNQAIESGQETTSRYFDTLRELSGAEKNALPVAVEKELLSRIQAVNSDKLTHEQVDGLVKVVNAFWVEVDSLKKSPNKYKLKELAGKSTATMDQLNKWCDNLQEIERWLSTISGGCYKAPIIKSILIPENASSFLGSASFDKPSNSAFSLRDKFKSIEEEKLSGQMPDEDRVKILKDLFTQISNFVNNPSTSDADKQLMLAYRGNLARRQADIIRRIPELTSLLSEEFN